VSTLRFPPVAAGQRVAVTGVAEAAHVLRTADALPILRVDEDPEREPESESLATEGSETTCSTPR
jgi:hypothetical protein